MVSYRYVLRRIVGDLWSKGTVVFVMLNPSTADARKNDPTIRRCIKFAASWGFRQLVVVNLYAIRATKPKDLKGFLAEGIDLVGPENDAAIRDAVREADWVVLAWGGTRAPGRDERVTALLSGVLAGVPVQCLGITKHGDPWHPLMVKGGTGMKPWTPPPPKPPKPPRKPKTKKAKAKKPGERRTKGPASVPETPVPGERART